jgi:hypothetical protein
MLLAALPGKEQFDVEQTAYVRSPSAASHEHQGVMKWTTRNRTLHEIGVDTLQYVDGYRSALRWTRPAGPLDDQDDRHSVGQKTEPSDEVSLDRDEPLLATPLTDQLLKSRARLNTGDPVIDTTPRIATLEQHKDLKE